MLPPDTKIISTVPFKLKDKIGKSSKVFDLKTQFGFIPEKIVISKVPQKHRIILSAILTDEIKAQLIQPRQKVKIPKKSIM